MPTESQILEVLSTVMDPELGRNLVELNMIRDIKIHKNDVSFTIALTVPGCPMRDRILRDARAAVQGVEGVRNVNITMSAMSDEERRKVLGGSQPPLLKLSGFNRIKQVVAVLSGKGGVGKSSVTARLAVALAKSGRQVGILDADITGPSIPKLFGLPPGGLRGNDQGILPGVTGLGIKVISTNLMVPEEDTAVIWRGPMVSGAIRQFFGEVLWGRLDSLLIDLPPGTSDATLTVLQSLPLDGVVLVTTPQQLSSLVVRKSVRMIEQLHVPIVGVVENMSYFACPDTGKRHEIFGPSHAGEVAALAGAPVLSLLPIDPSIAALADSGNIEQASTAGFEPIISALDVLPVREQLPV